MENESTGTTYKVQIVCSRPGCGNDTFRASKITKPYPGREQMIADGVLAHDGFGWELSDMDITCAVCGGDPKVDIEPMPNEEGEGKHGE